MTNRRDALLAIAHVSPRLPTARGLELAVSESLWARDLLRTHRVLSLGAAQLQHSALADPDGAVLAYAADKRSRRKELDATWDQLAAATVDIGIAAAGMKGRAAGRLYDDPGLRDSNDIDLMIASADDAWGLAAWLRHRGWLWCPAELPWLKRDRVTGRIYGQARLQTAPTPSSPAVDIHFGGYSVRSSRFLPYNSDAVGLGVLSPAENLPMLVGNVAGDYVILQKDINDIVLMVQSNAEHDWDSALRQMSQVGLGGVWNALLAEVVRTSDLTDEQHRIVRGVRLHRAPFEILPFGRQLSRRRAIATAVDAYRAGSARHSRLRGAARVYRAYSGNAAMTTMAECRHRAPDATVTELGNVECVRLVPLARSASEAFTDSEYRCIDGSVSISERIAEGHSFVDVAGEVFAPTVDYDLCPIQATHLESV